MHNADAYFARKNRELALIAGGPQGETKRVDPPADVRAIIETKLRLAAALRAQYAQLSWADTETSWSGAGPLRIGPFEFSYRYQRADLSVAGPLPYPFVEGAQDITVQGLGYTCSGMAAISSLLHVLAAHRLSRVRLLPGGYKETMELMQRYGLPPRLAGAAPDAADVLWIDSSRFPDLEASCHAAFRLIVCDTTCSAAQSARIRRVVAFARRMRTPLVLVRSHIKLDSLGVEFGRLGSALFLAFGEVPLAKLRILRQLAKDLPEAIRLSGTAAVPAHFCPFFGSDEYWRLSASRCAAILRNTRALRAALVARIGRASVRGYPHGMFAALVPAKEWGQPEFTAAAADIARGLAGRGLPVRHAGSFGFDFVAMEAFFDTQLERFVLRIAPGDLPMPMTLELADRIASWWRWRFQARAA